MSSSLSPNFTGRAPAPRVVGPDRPRFWSDGTPIGTLPPGWSLLRTRRIADELTIFDIEDSSLGTTQSWFADGAGKLLGHRPDLLPPNVASALRRHIMATGPLGLRGPDGVLRLDDGYMSELVTDGIVESSPGLLVRDQAGVLTPIILPDGSPLGHFNQGWSSRHVFTGLASMLAIDLVGPNGATGFWLVDRTGGYLGGSLHGLGEEHRLAIHDYAMVRAAWPIDRMDHGLTGYCLLNDVFLSEFESLLAHPQTRPQRRDRLARTDPARTGATPPSPLPLATSITLDLHRPGCVDQMVGGWFRAGQRNVASGRGAGLPFELPYRPAAMCLSLELAGIGRPRQVTVSLGGWDLATFVTDPAASPAERRDIWIPPECLRDNAACFELSFDPSDRSIACALIVALLEVGPEATPVTIPPVSDLMGCFGSLGIDCEFGFVQRVFGIEPLGLFRFAGPGGRSNLRRLIETDFAGMGAPGSLVAKISCGQVMRPGGEVAPMEEFYMRDNANCYGFHTWSGPAETTEADAVAANLQKVAYMVRAMREDLEDGEKIWVYKDPKPVADYHEVFGILRALGRKAPNKLFWVTRMVEGRPPGAVEWVAPNLLRGYSDQPHHDAQVFDAGKWRTLCSNAYRAFAERGRQDAIA